MKTTVVPSQVTTVEDKIMGNLGFSQLLLIITPIFLGVGLFALLPPLMSGNIYKYVIIGIITCASCLLAIRIKGKIVAQWLSVIVRYNLRPQLYLFNKNTTELREEYRSISPETKTSVTPIQIVPVALAPSLNYYETEQALAAAHDPASHIRFETTKKGLLNVRLTHIKK